MTATDHEAMRVANRYAAQVEKAETMQGRARACRDAADRYRSDARTNQESAENHQMAARTIRDPHIAVGHARVARDAEAEAAREILAARHYEAQADQYEAQAADDEPFGGGSQGEVVLAAPTAGAEVQSGAMHLPGGEYLDWSAATAAGTRHLELGDGSGSEVVVLELGPAQQRELCEQLHLTLTADDQAEHFVTFGDGDGDSYIDWSHATPEGGRQLEIGDADGNAVYIEVGRGELQALYDQFAVDIAEPAMVAVGGEQDAGGCHGTDQDARGAVSLGRGDDAPYLDWSIRTAAGARNLEFGDGYDAVNLDLSPTQLRELHDALTATIDADDLTEEHNAYWPEENGDAYIDWSDFEYERGFQLEIGDGTTAVSVALSVGQLRAWRDRLAADLADGDL